MSKYIAFLVSVLLLTLVASSFYIRPGKMLFSEHNIATGPQSGSTLVTAFIAPFVIPGIESKSVRIFGFTSPGASVYSSGRNISDVTTAQGNGYFEFPLTTIYKTSKEICLRAKDTQDRFSTPNCIPIYFSADLEAIGPILIAPTLSISEQEFQPNEKINISGQAIPNKNVRINVSSTTDSNKTSTLISTSDKEGKFITSTSYDKPQKISLYSGVSLNGSNSPKSSTLTITILPWLLIVFRALLSFIAKHAVELALLVESILALLYFIFFRAKKRHPIAIYNSKLLARIKCTTITSLDNHSMVVFKPNYLKQI